MILNQCAFLQVSLAESECAVARQREQHRQTTASLQSEMEESRRSHWEKVEGERRKCEEVRRKLEQRLGEVEGEGERVRLEVTAHYEEDARKTHHQHRTQVCVLVYTLVAKWTLLVARWSSWRVQFCTASLRARQWPGSWRK